MEMPRAERLYVVVDGAEEPSVSGEADEYNVSVYADRDGARDGARHEARLAGKEAMTLTPDELKAKLEGAWADVTHVVYFPASNVGVQVSTDRFNEVY
jgi:hypothetical protein